MQASSIVNVKTNVSQVERYTQAHQYVDNSRQIKSQRLVIMTLQLNDHDLHSPT